LKVSLHIGQNLETNHPNQYYPSDKMVRIPNIDLNQEYDEVVPTKRVCQNHHFSKNLGY
jgi:hypothetical protein